MCATGSTLTDAKLSRSDHVHRAVPAEPDRHDIHDHPHRRPRSKTQCRGTTQLSAHYTAASPIKIDAHLVADTMSAPLDAHTQWIHRPAAGGVNRPSMNGTKTSRARTNLGRRLTP